MISVLPNVNLLLNYIKRYVFLFERFVPWTFWKCGRCYISTTLYCSL